MGGMANPIFRGQAVGRSQENRFIPNNDCVNLLFILRFLHSLSFPQARRRSSVGRATDS